MLLIRNIRTRATGKLFLTLMFVAVVGACSESSPPSKQEAAPTAEERLTQLQKQADSGDADAQFNLGIMYRKGEGVPKDANKAVEWWQKGLVEKVRAYCIEDVRLTKELYDYALAHGSVKYKDLRDVREIKLDTSNWGKDAPLSTMTHALPL